MISALESHPEVEAAVTELLEIADEDSLFEQLGLRSQLVTADFGSSAEVEPAIRPVDELVSRDDLRELGRRVFDEVNAAAWQLVCGTNPSDEAERKQIVGAFGAGPTALAGYLAVTLISVGISPLFAPVVAALVVKLFLKPTYEATCEFWKERL